MTATYLAAEGIEIVKGIMDNNLTSQTNAGGDLCGNWFENFVHDGNPAGETYQLQYDCTDPIVPTPACAQLFHSESNTKLKFSNITYTYNYTDGNDTPFTRTIQVVPKSDSSVIDSSGYPPQEAQIISTVKWNSGTIPQSIQLEDHFFDWRRVGIVCS